MTSIGLYLAVAASGCCAYLAGLFIERWVTWPTPHSRAWAFLIGGTMILANIILVDLASRLDMPIPGGALAVALQIQVFVAFLVLSIGLREVFAAASVVFIGFNIGFLTVQLVGMRLAFALPDMPEITAFWWFGGSFMLLSALAIKGMRHELWQRAVRDGGLADQVIGPNREGERQP